LSQAWSLGIYQDGLDECFDAADVWRFGIAVTSLGALMQSFYIKPDKYRDK